MWTTGGGSGLLISMLEELSWLNNTGVTDVKIDESVIEEKLSF